MRVRRSDRRGGGERRRREERRSGEDRRKLDDPKYDGPERRGSQVIYDDPRCHKCIASLGELEILVLECPFPLKGCLYKQHYQIFHYVTYPSRRTENETTVVVSTPADILSPNIILKRPDPIMANHQVYYIDLTDNR